MKSEFEITIEAEINRIPDVSARLEEAMQAGGFRDEDILDTQLAVEEAITNVIMHGYKQKGGVIRIAGDVTDGTIEIRIEDSAPPFNPLSIPEPDLDADISERRIGGLGIYLIRQVMTGLAYRHEAGKNILVMTKKRAG